MGRRALAPVDPNVNLDAHFVQMDKYEGDLDLFQWFETPGPIELEIGSGKGLFIRNAAAANPDRRYIGIEIARKYARYAAFGLARRGIDNAVMISGDAKLMVREMIADASFDAVHVYFPDPWWKSRHRKRRVLEAGFIPQLERILKPGGILHFWTDVQEYFDETLGLLKTHTTLEGPLTVEERPPEHDLDYQTHFERRMRQHDKPIYRSEFLRQAK